MLLQVLLARRLVLFVFLEALLLGLRTLCRHLTLRPIRIDPTVLLLLLVLNNVGGILLEELITNQVVGMLFFVPLPMPLLPLLLPVLPVLTAAPLGRPLLGLLGLLVAAAARGGLLLLWRLAAAVADVVLEEGVVVVDVIAVRR